MSNSWFLKSFVVLAVFAAPAAVRAADLKGTFVYDGDAPMPAQVMDPKVASDFPGKTIYYEDLVVDPASKGIANIAVYIRTEGIPVTPEAEKAAMDKVVLDNSSGHFVPHLVGLWVGKQKLIFKNSDPVPHNSNFPYAAVNPLLPVNAEMEIAVAGVKLLPQNVSCSIHPWMKSNIVLRNNPYTAVTDKNGSFVLKNLPEGVELEIQFWQEKAGYLDFNPAWPKGRLTTTLQAGETDLGTHKVPAAVFNK